MRESLAVKPLIDKFHLLLADVNTNCGEGLCPRKGMGPVKRGFLETLYVFKRGGGKYDTGKGDSKGGKRGLSKREERSRRRVLKTRALVGKWEGWGRWYHRTWRHWQTLDLQSQDLRGGKRTDRRGGGEGAGGGFSTRSGRVWGQKESWKTEVRTGGAKKNEGSGKERLFSKNSSQGGRSEEERGGGRGGSGLPCQTDEETFDPMITRGEVKKQAERKGRSITT